MAFEVLVHPDVERDIEELPDIASFNEPWGELYRELEQLELEGPGALIGGVRVKNAPGMYLHQMKRDRLVAFVCSEHRQRFHIVSVSAPISENDWTGAGEDAMRRLCAWLGLPPD